MSKKIGENIKKELEKQERTYAWLGRKVGTSSADISKLLTRLEAGGSVTIDKLERIAEALKVDLSKLIK